MATNEILQFAETDTGTNLLTQAEYLADSQRPIGNQPGVARSKLVNKALRQASLIAAGIAEYIADNQANNVTDALTPQNIADYLQAAITGALGVTPPQFDNDTLLATTAFVQRALGNYQSSYSQTVTATLTAANAGAICNAFNSITLTLPLGSAVPVGATYKINNTGSGVVSVVANAGNNLYAIGNGTPRSFNLQSGDELTIAYVGGNAWYAWGSGQLGFSLGAFGASLSGSGYQKLPSGLIIQWGGLSFPTSGSQQTGTATYPIAFPNSVFQVVAGIYQNSTLSSNDLVAFIATGSTLSQVTLRAVNPSAGSSAAKFIAIGY